MKKKLNINRPKITSEEIAQRKNFDSVLKNHANISVKPLLKKPWFLSSVIVATVAIVTSVVLLNQQPTTDNQQLSSNNQQLTTNNELEFYKKEEAKPCINPPLKDVNVLYTTYKVIAEKGASLDFKTGSKLLIPKNAFVDDKGKPVKGQVELRYREFHDPIDFFVSGIPMTYDSAGVKYQFESAGMMEMLAYQDGKPVNMAPTKSINVELASNYKGTEYNLYKLDTVKNNWTCLGKDKVVGNIKRDVTEENNKPLTRQQEKMADSVSKFITKVLVEKEKKINELLVSNKIPVQPKQSQKSKYTFDIAVEQNEFPELAVYKGVLFEVGDENKNFTKSLYDIIWDEATIKEGTKKGENYLMTLKKASKKYDFIVYPVFEGENYKTAKDEYDYLLNRYNKELESRKLKEKQIEDGYQQMIALAKKLQEERERKWKQEQANQFKQMDTEEKVMRMFAINSFGVFNCDNPSVYPKGINCNANLTNDKNVKLMCYNIYLVDKAKNGLFTYYKNPITTFSFNPQSTNLLWTVENGVLYWLKPEQFSSINGSNGISNLKMNRVDQKFTSVDELKTYFNF